MECYSNPNLSLKGVLGYTAAPCVLGMSFFFLSKGLLYNLFEHKISEDGYNLAGD